MCEATTIFAIGLALTAASGAYAADSQKKAGQYQADVAAENAKLDDFRAEQSSRLGSIQEEQQRAKVRQMVGTQRATLAANGIDMSSGTAADMIDEAQTMGEVDALTIRFNAMNEAWGYRTNATNSRNEGAFARWSGKRQATGTYLSTAASMASMGYSAYGQGMFSKGGKVGGVQKSTFGVDSSVSVPKYRTSGWMGG